MLGNIPPPDNVLNSRLMLEYERRTGEEPDRDVKSFCLRQA